MEVEIVFPLINTSSQHIRLAITIERREIGEEEWNSRFPTSYLEIASTAPPWTLLQVNTVSEGPCLVIFHTIDSVFTSGRWVNVTMPGPLLHKPEGIPTAEEVPLAEFNEQQTITEWARSLRRTQNPDHGRWIPRRRWGRPE